MRALGLALILLATGCSAPPASLPSLAPRPAEAIDPRLPVPEPVLPTTPDPKLVSQLDALVHQAVAGDAVFQPVMDRAEQLAGAAGAPSSESWVVAQQALSAAVEARAPVTRAAADIDALGTARIQRLGGIAAADLKALNAAVDRVREIDEREAARLDQLQGRLPS